MIDQTFTMRSSPIKLDLGTIIKQEGSNLDPKQGMKSLAYPTC